jgi:hypothetical protein
MGLTIAVAAAMAALAMGAGGVAAAAATGSTNPVSWGRAVVRAVRGHAIVPNQAPDAVPSGQGTEPAVHASPEAGASATDRGPAPVDPVKGPDKHPDKDAKVHGGPGGKVSTAVTPDVPPGKGAREIAPMTAGTARPDVPDAPKRDKPAAIASGGATGRARRRVGAGLGGSLTVPSPPGGGGD